MDAKPPRINAKYFM